MRFLSCLALEEQEKADQKGETLQTFVSLMNETDNVIKCGDCDHISTSSEFLLVHLWHTAALVSGHLSSDWIHHGLEDERV